jgi:hypothetical protein
LNRCERMLAIRRSFRAYTKSKSGKLSFTILFGRAKNRNIRYTNYFQFLYRTIEARLKSELASRWEDAKIEYIFSVPTTWKPAPTVERFRKIIAAAGFGLYPNHTATIGLTEAEAAAVHTARNMPGIFKVSSRRKLVLDIAS